VDNCSSHRPPTQAASVAPLQSAISVAGSLLGTTWGLRGRALPRAWAGRRLASAKTRGAPQKNADLLLTETKSSPSLPPPT
jgi:hypothetical protein